MRHTVSFIGMASRNLVMLQELLDSRVVVQLDEIRAALGNASRATAFRYLRKASYRRSYNHNGSFYTGHDPTKYDQFGLFSHKGVHFSRDGSLSSTVVRLVQEAPAGQTQHELQALLRVRVQGLLLEAVRRGTIDRELMEKVFIYLHIDPSVRQAQLEQRRALITAARTEVEVTDTVVIQVLLTLVRHPGSSAADVVRHLQGQSPPITMQHVRVVFDRYDLEHLGEKGGR